MKRIVLLSLFTLVFTQLKAQQTIVFKFKYLPNHNYASNITMHNNIELNFRGTEEELEKLKGEGVHNPMAIVGATSMDYNVKTSSYNKGQIFPVLISYTNVVNKQLMDGKELPLPKNDLIGRNIYGHSDLSGALSVDSVSGKSNNKDSLVNIVATILKTINKQIKFPEKGIKIGELFTQDMPMNLPIMGNSVPVAMKITYKLTDVKDGIGYFDVGQTTTFSMTTERGPLDIKGKGTGKLQFSIKDSFPVHYESNTELNYNMVISNFTVDGLAKISTVFDTKIN
jgi:hypothetical protein